MVRKICLDSDILIEFLRENKEIKEKIESLGGQFYTTSINVFEIWGGRIKSEEKMIDIRDIFVGARCIENKQELLTNNRKHFERLKKFGLVLVEQ